MRKPSSLPIWLLLFLPACTSAPPPEDTAREESAKVVQDNPAVAAILQRLAADDNEQQAEAAQVLAEMGAREAPVIAGLTAAVTDDDAKVRARAARALGLLAGSNDDEAVKALVHTANDPNVVVRREAIRAIATIAPDPAISSPVFAAALVDNDASVVMPALHALTDRGQDAVPLLLKALDKEKSRYWALLALGELGPSAKPAVKPITKILSTAEPEVRMQALMTLGAIGKDSASAVEEIKAAVGDDVAAVQFAAIYALGQVGTTQDADALNVALESDDKFTKTVAAWSVAKLDPQRRDKCMEVLLDSLKSPDNKTRQFAVRGMLDLKPDSETEIAGLVTAMNDADPIVQANLLETLATLGPKIVPSVAKALKDKDRRVLAAQILSKMGPKAKTAVPELLAVLGDEDTDFRCEVLCALGAIGDEAAESVGPLAKSLHDEDDHVCASCSYALGKIGPNAKAAVPDLKQQLEHKDPFRRLMSTWALLQIMPGDAEIQKLAIPHLIEALGLEGREMARLEAAAALGEIGPLAKEALPALETAAAKDHSPVVREVAKESIKKISGKS